MPPPTLTNGLFLGFEPEPCCKGASIKNIHALGEGRVSSNADKIGQGEGGGLALSGYLFQCGL